jgi:hypothetical protein
MDMRALIVCAALLAAVTAAAVGTGAPPAPACTAPPPPQQDTKHQKASSFAPRARAANNAYGQPIQPTILHRRVKPKKPATQAVSVPAQDLPSTPVSGG